MIQTLAGYGARAAIASGWIMVAGAVVTVLFFALEAPAMVASGKGITTWTLLGRGSDALVGLSMLVALPLAALLRERWRDRAVGVSTLAFAVGLAAMVDWGVVGVISLGNLAPYASLATPGLAGVTGFGLWMIAVNWGMADEAIRGRLRQLGVAVGIGWPLQALAYLAGGGPSALSDPQAALSNPIFVVLLVLGVLSVFVGYPIWAISLGRRLAQPELGAQAAG